MPRRFATSALTVGVLLRVASACVGEDPDLSDASTPDSAAPPGDSGSGDAGTVQDGSSDSGRCLASDPFGPLESLGAAINTSGNEYPGRFSSDLLSFVFARQEVGPGHVEPQIFVARRTSISGKFESAAPAFDAPTGQHDQEPSFTPWGAIVFHRGEQGSTQLMMAAPNGSGFAAAVALNGTINAAGTERSAFVATDGTLYFSRAPAGAGPISNGYELFMSAANNDQTFAAPTPVPGLARPEQSETVPVANGAGTVIYFSSVFNYDAGDGIKSDTSIFRAERASRSVEFGLPQPVPGLNSQGYETTAWASDDDCTIVVAHREADAGSTIDLFISRRQRL